MLVDVTLPLWAVVLWALALIAGVIQLLIRRDNRHRPVVSAWHPPRESPRREEEVRAAVIEGAGISEGARLAAQIELQVKIAAGAGLWPKSVRLKANDWTKLWGYFQDKYRYWGVSTLCVTPLHNPQENYMLCVMPGVLYRIRIFIDEAVEMPEVEWEEMGGRTAC